MKKMWLRSFSVPGLLLILVAAAIPGAQAQTVSVLYNFNSATTDPYGFYNPGTFAQGQDGNIYTTSSSGGVGNGTGVSGNGTIFSMTSGGTLSVLNTFNAGISPGYGPLSGVVLGTDGNVYGTTEIGGGAGCVLGCGIVFKYGSNGLGTLYAFTGGSDGGSPIAGPVEGNDGNYYGTTSLGGGSTGCGTVYKITPTGVLTTLYQFDSTHGCTSNAPLVLGTDGNFYGVTTYGGTHGVGVVFKISPAGKEATIFNFDGTHGQFPESPLVQGTDGNFYGTAETGGMLGSGVVFQITSSGKIRVLHNFPTGASDGQAPTAGLVQALDGNFYGATLSGGTLANGTLYRINSAGTYSVLYNFDGTTASTPYVGLIQHTNGVFFGLTVQDGTSNSGTFYSFDAGLAPFVNLVTTSGKLRATVEILGQGLTGTSGVSFNGIAATYTVVSDTYLTATVPSGATTGTVTVTTPGGALPSNKVYRVVPSIKTFSPSSGTVGTSVVITGVSLTQTTKVTFGGVAATTFTVNSDTKVTATVPTGAKTGKIAITTAGGTATSAGTFTVTL